MRSAFFLAFCLTVSGCVVATDTEPIVVDDGAGLLVVDWSIDGFQDPSVCRQSDADVISVGIETSSGVFVGEFEQSCEAFATSIELPADGYFGDAVLLDPEGGARTTAVDLGYFEIFGNDELVVPIDFPSDSFY